MNAWRSFARGVVCGFFALAGTAAISAPAMAQGAGPGTDRPNILIISWDGVQRDHLYGLSREGKLPNLDRLRTEGRLIPIEITDHKSDTKAGHAQILTGYAPEVTGVFGNAKYDAIPLGLSVFERLEEANAPGAFATHLLTGKSGNIGSRPAEMRREGKRIKPAKAKGAKGGKKTASTSGSSGETGKGKRKEKGQKKLISCPAQPWNRVKDRIDVWDGDRSRPASEVGPAALAALDRLKDAPFFFFLHFSDPDHAGHRHGENSPEYSKAITTADEWLGRLREKLSNLGIADRTVIYVTTDHGFDEGRHSHFNAPHVWLATNDGLLTATQGDMKDIAPTLLKRGGYDLSKAAPPLPGKPLF